jgi:hypothetical protein
VLPARLAVPAVAADMPALGGATLPVPPAPALGPPAPPLVAGEGEVVGDSLLQPLAAENSAAASLRITNVFDSDLMASIIE